MHWNPPKDWVTRPRSWVLALVLLLGCEAPGPPESSTILVHTFTVNCISVGQPIEVPELMPDHEFRMYACREGGIVIWEPVRIAPRTLPPLGFRNPDAEVEI